MLDNTQSIICAVGLAAAAPRSPYRHLELCGIALKVNARCTNTVQRAFFIGNLQLFQRGLYADDGFFLAHHSGQVGAAAGGTGFAGQGNA